MAIQARQDDSTSQDNRGGFFVTSTIVNGYGFEQVITATVGTQALTTTLSTDRFGFESLVTKVLPSESLTTTTSINRLGYPVEVTRRITASPSSRSSTPSATPVSRRISESSASSSTGSTNTAGGLGAGTTAGSDNASEQTPNVQPQRSSEGSLSGGEIAAAVVVPVIVVVAALFFLGCCHLRRRKGERASGGGGTRSHPEMQSLADRPSTRRASPRPTIPPDQSVAPPPVDYFASDAVTNGTSTGGKRSIESPAQSYQRNFQSGNKRAAPAPAPARAPGTVPTAPTSATLAGPPQLDDWRADDIGRLMDPFGDAAHHSSSGGTSASSRSVGLPIQGATAPTTHSHNSQTPGHEQKLSDVPSSGLVSNEPRTASRGAVADDDAVSIGSDVSYHEADEAEVAEVAHARPTHMQRASVVQLTGNGHSPPREGGLSSSGGHKHSRTKSSDAGFPQP